MLNKKIKIAIIGAGWFGCHIAYELKKKDFYVNIFEEDGKILTLKHGYPQFYTQILFEKDKPEIFVKAVLNDIESLSKISTCKKIEKFDQES